MCEGSGEYLGPWECLNQDFRGKQYDRDHEVGYCVVRTTPFRGKECNNPTWEKLLDTYLRIRSTARIKFATFTEHSLGV